MDLQSEARRVIAAQQILGIADRHKDHVAFLQEVEREVAKPQYLGSGVSRTTFEIPGADIVVKVERCGGNWYQNLREQAAAEERPDLLATVYGRRHKLNEDGALVFDVIVMRRARQMPWTSELDAEQTRQFLEVEHTVRDSSLSNCGMIDGKVVAVDGGLGLRCWYDEVTGESTKKGIPSL